MLDLTSSAFVSSPTGLVWLAGLLEAEGTFLKPAPSNQTCPIVSCRITDRDVVERVAKMFGTSVVSIDKGRFRTEYAANLKGSRAVLLMSDLRPLMGRRRSAAIDAAISGYSPPQRKLDFDKAVAIRLSYSRGQTVSALARSFGVTRQTIHAVLQLRIYAAPERTPWRNPPRFLSGLICPPDGFSSPEFLWLAGWLEGEGSFCAPPPSDPRRPRVIGQCGDQDVILEVARVMQVSPAIQDSQRIRNRGWSPTWRVLLRGSRAISLMHAIEPVMGTRRARQIHAAIDAARAAGNMSLIPAPG